MSRGAVLHRSTSGRRTAQMDLPLSDDVIGETASIWNGIDHWSGVAIDVWTLQETSEGAEQSR